MSSFTQTGLRQSLSNYSFGNGLAPFRDKSGLYGYIDNTGSVQIEPEFLCAGPFRDGVAAVGLSTNSKQSILEVGFIDQYGMAGIRHGDIYPVSGSEIVLPLYNAGMSFSYSSIEQKDVFNDKSGFQDMRVPAHLLNYSSYFNSDGIAVADFVNPDGSLIRRRIISLDKNFDQTLYINGVPQDPQFESARDLIRSILISRPSNLLIKGFGNTLSDGFYLFEDVDTEGNNHLLTWNSTKNRFDNVFKSFADLEMSQFYQGNAIWRKKDNTLLVLDKAFTPKNVSVDTSWCRHNIQVCYHPGSRHAVVMSVSESDDEYQLNCFDLVEMKWMLNSAIVSNQAFFAYGEVIGNFLYYRGAEVRPLDYPLNIHNVETDRNIATQVKDAGEARDGLVCVEKYDGSLEYLTESGKVIYTFNA